MGRRGKPGRKDRQRGWGVAVLLLLMRRLAQAPATVREVADELGVSYRTVFRLMRTLGVVGLRIERYREGQRVLWRIPKGALREWLKKEEL